MNLRKRLRVQELNNGVASDVTWIWGELIPTTRYPTAQAGILFIERPLQFNIRYSRLIRPHMYVVDDDGLYLILTVQPMDASRRFMQLACSPFVGFDAIYTPVTGNPVSVLAWLNSASPQVGGEYSSVTTYRRTIEVPKIQMAATPVFGDTITFNGLTWTVAAIDENGDDGIVVRMQVRQ